MNCTTHNREQRGHLNHLNKLFKWSDKVFIGRNNGIVSKTYGQTRPEGVLGNKREQNIGPHRGFPTASAYFFQQLICFESSHGYVEQ